MQSGEGRRRGQSGSYLPRPMQRSKKKRLSASIKNLLVCQSRLVQLSSRLVPARLCPITEPISRDRPVVVTKRNFIGSGRENREPKTQIDQGTDPRRTEGSGFFSFLVTVVWLIIVWITGRWTLPFNAWTFNDFVFTWFIAFLWILVPALIAGAIFLIWWLRKEPKEES